MGSLSHFFEIFTLITGVIYIVLEIRQKNFMWVVGVVTSLAAMWVFFRQGLYASFGLNTYYLITSIVGLWQWRKDKKRLDLALSEADAALPGKTADAKKETTGAAIHLNHLNVKVLVVSVLITLAGTFALAGLMKWLENPMSYLDSLVAVLSAVATWWLVKSYPQQWLLWIVADSLSVALCAMQGLWWMTVLYAAYSLSAVYGYWHWKKKGTYI